MDRTTHPLAAWLGPALHDLTAEQLDRLAAEAHRIDARYPDPDEQHKRDAALSAATQYLLGETDAAAASATLNAARLALAEAMAASQQVAAMLVGDHVSEVQAARAVGIDRMTLREALGKR